MDRETRMLLERYLDGESAPGEAIAVEALLERDPAAKRCLEELNLLRQTLETAHQEPQEPVPSWESVRDRETAAEEGKGVSIRSHWKLVSSMAAILVLGMLLWIPVRTKMVHDVEPAALSLGETVEMVETDLENATPIVYLDQPSGWTVVWVSQPDENQDI